MARLTRDTRGIAAVEFGLIAPVMALMLVGAIELTRAVSIDRRFSLATSMVADLVAREEKLSAADVTAIYDIVEQVMSPFDAAPLKISIVPVMSNVEDASKTAVYAEATNRPSYNGASEPLKCEAYALTPGLIGANESVIVIEASYTFAPMFGSFVMHDMVLQDKAYAKPRNLCVDFDGTNCISDCSLLQKGG